MIRSSYIRARIAPDVKAEAEAVFEQLGITPSQVITMLYKQVSRKHEIPLDLYLPNKETAKAIEEARRGEGITIYKNATELYDDIGI